MKYCVYICINNIINDFTKVNIKTRQTMKSINLARKHHEIISKEFNHVSRQTIYSSLKYFNNSEVAQKIRKRALELLEAEVKENKIIK